MNDIYDIEKGYTTCDKRGQIKAYGFQSDYYDFMRIDITYEENVYNRKYY